MSTQPKITTNAAAIAFIKSLPRSANGKGRAWSKNVAGIAALAVYLSSLKGKPRGDAMELLAAETGVAFNTIYNLSGGRHPDGTVWHDLRKEIVVFERASKPAATPAAAKTNGVTYNDAKWRLLENNDIEVTKVLQWGTAEYTAFLRRVLPECGTVRHQA